MKLGPQLGVKRLGARVRIAAALLGEVLLALFAVLVTPADLPAVTFSVVGARVLLVLAAPIASGSLPVGKQIPSMSQLRELYNVSNTVIRDALNELRSEGLIIGQQGKGVFVQEQPQAVNAASNEARLIHERLDAITQTVRRLDERMAALEQAAAQDSPAQRQSTQDAE